MFGSGDLGMGISIVLIDEFSDGARRVSEGMLTIEDRTARLGAKTFLLNQFSQGLGMVQGALNSIIEPGAAFNQNVQELSALTGITGRGLNDLGDRALGLAKKYGGDASGGVNTFKNILGKLGPEIAQNSEALQLMGSDAFTLSKTMSNDLAGATGALTTSMNIFAGSITDPMLMAQEMTRQMNVMAAGAKVGSAEVTDIAASIRTGGLAAKSAGVSFEELNALIQIMGKGAVYGSEAGIAIRNVLGIMSQGEYLPKKALEGLRAAGVDLALIGNAAVPIERRLQEIAKIQNNAALITEVFGRENSNAFRVLAENLNLLPDWTAAMTGTSEATDQAAIVMQSFSEKMNRLKARLDSYRIAVFNATKEVLPFVKGTLDLAQGLVSVGPAIVLAQEGLAAWRATAFATTLANGGLIVAFEGLAAAVWAASIPLLPYIAIGAAVVGVLYLAYKAVDSFQNLLATGKVEGGFWGVLQQIGGVVLGVIEVFKSWNGFTFTFSQNMRDSLEKIGVLDLVLRLATWAVRVKEFFTGLAQAARDTGAWLAQAFGAAWDYIGPLFGEMNVWWLTIKKLAGETLNWRIAGQALGEVLGFVAKLVGGVLLAVLFAVGLVFYAIARAIGIVVDIIQDFIVKTTAMITLIGDVIAWFSNWREALGDVAGVLNNFWDLFLEGAGIALNGFVNFGVRIALAIRQGIASAWDGLKTWLAGMVQSLPFGSQIVDFFSGEPEAAAPSSVSRRDPAGASPAGIARTMAQMPAAQAAAQRGAPAAAAGSSANGQPLIAHLYLDGRQIHETVFEVEAEKAGRK